MAISLYRDGDTHVIRGVTCEMGRFEVHEREHALSVGWRTKPEETVDVDQEENETVLETEMVPLDEADFDKLKEYADSINMKYAANIGEDTLREKLRKKLDI